MGKKPLDHHINTLWRAPQNTFLDTLFVTFQKHTFLPSFSYLAIPFPQCTFSSLCTNLDPFPIWQPFVEDSGDPNHEVAGPFPRTATVAQLQKKGICCSYFALVSRIYLKNKKYCYRCYRLLLLIKFEQSFVP